MPILLARSSAKSNCFEVGIRSVVWPELHVLGRAGDMGIRAPVSGEEPIRFQYSLLYWLMNSEHASQLSRAIGHTSIPKLLAIRSA
jgi:hypothetical protein